MQSEHEKFFGTFSPKKNATFFNEADPNLHISSKNCLNMHLKTPTKGASHIFLKRNTYYFRFAFPLVLKKRLGYSEIRISLRTGYRRQALNHGQVLYGNLREMLMSNPELDYSTIKTRLNDLLMKLMGQIDHQERKQLSFQMAAPGRKSILKYPDLKHTQNGYSNIPINLFPKDKNRDLLDKLVDVDKISILSHMVNDGAFSESEISSNKDEILDCYPFFFDRLQSYKVRGKSKQILQPV